MTLLIDTPSYIGDPYGIRTRVVAVKGRCPRPLDEGANKLVTLVLQYRTEASKLGPGSAFSSAFTLLTTFTYAALHHIYCQRLQP